MEPLIIIGGEVACSLDVRDRGLAYGHGVFETMKLADGRLPLWFYHEARLIRGLQILGIPWLPDAINASLHRLLGLCPANGVVKLTVTAGHSGRGYAPPDAPVPTVIAMWLPAGNPAAEVRLQLSDYRLPLNPVLAGIKHLNRLDQVIAARSVASGWVPLLLDAQGRLVEALSHNVFVYHGGRWRTPDLQACGVAGVMRALLLAEVMPALGLPVEVGELDDVALQQADEVFVCNGVVGVQNVAEIAAVKVFHTHSETDRIRSQLARMYSCFTV